MLYLLRGGKIWSDSDFAYRNRNISLSTVVQAFRVPADHKKPSPFNAVLQVVLPNHGEQSVLVRDIQRNVLSGKFRHIDFFQINANQKVDTKVTIHLTGEPVGVKNGGILQVELHEIDVRCMADKLFTSFEVDTSGLAIGDQLLVSDLAIHDGVEVLTDASSMVVTVLPPTAISAPVIAE